MKRFWPFITAAALAMALFAGCTGSQPETQGDPTPSPAEETGNASPTEPQPEAAGGDLSGSLLWLNNSGEEANNQWQDLMADQFMEANPGVSIEIQRMSFDNYVTTLQTKIASGDAPDVFTSEGDQLKTFYDNGYLADFSAEPWMSNFNLNDLANTTFDGQIVAIPTDAGSMCVTYSKDAFAAAGIESVPTTLDEFYEMCDTLQAAGIEPIAAGFKETWCLMADIQTDYIVAVLGQDPNAILDLLSREKTFAESDLWRESFQRLFDRYEYVSSDPFGTDWSAAGDLVASGRAAMVLNGTWSISHIREKGPDVNMGVFALPISNNADDTKLLVQSPNSGACVYSESPNLIAAKAFVGHMSLPESGTLLAQMSQKMSIIIGAQGPEEPAWADIYAYMERGDTFSQGAIDHNFPNEYRVAVETVVSKHLLADRELDAMLAELDAEFDRIAEAG